VLLVGERLQLLVVPGLTVDLEPVVSTHNAVLSRYAW
jgi:hypothetical protein